MRFSYQTGARPLAGYTIQRGIHRGGFGEVYFAQSDGGKYVALKLLNHQDQDVELRGVSQCLNLKHPNLVNLFDVKTDSLGDHWVVMEYVAGSSLDDVLASFPHGLPIAEVRDWLSGLVAGVSFLHERGIVHRDLKPANIYRENGIVKIGDVGLSKRLESDHRRQHTQSVGTVYYMAPEVANGKYGPQVDVYALGIILYELFTGKVPFHGETTAEILMKHLTAQPDLTPIPTSLRPVIARAMEKDPLRRTASASELEQDFLQALGDIPARNGDLTSQKRDDLPEPTPIPASLFLPPLPRDSSRESQTSPSISPWRVQHFERHRIRSRDPIEPPDAAGEVQPQSTQRPILNHRDWLTLTIVLAAILFLIRTTSGSVRIGRMHLPTVIGVILLLCIPAAAFGCVRIVKSLLRRAAGSKQSRADLPPRSADDRSRQSTRMYPTQRTSGPQIRPWSDRMPELANSLAFSALVSVVLSIGVCLVLSAPMPKHASNPIMPRPEHAALFASGTIVASWFMLIGNALTCGPDWTHTRRWLARIATGVMVGSLLFLLDDFLLVDFTPTAYRGEGLFSSLGGQPLMLDRLNPTWLSYAVFFAGWMGLRRWSREMDPGRALPLRIWKVIAAVVVAFVVSTVFRFPQVYAMLWAGTISTTVQLASPWAAIACRPEER